MVRWADFEDWCDWALAQADELDPVKNLESLLNSGQILPDGLGKHFEN
jgi:hypothetical protein